MIALAVGLGVLGFFALRHARRRCCAPGYHGSGWHGPWASTEHACGYYGGCDDGDAREGDHGEHGHHGRHGRHRRYGRGYGPPWMRGGWRGRRGRRWILHAALSRIDATPAQERVIVGELDRLQERVHAARGGLEDTHADLAAALRGPLLDDAALGAVLGRVDGATSEVRAAAIEAVRNMHAVLDDKQRAELADLIQRREGRGGGGGGGAGWFRMGPYR